MDRQLQRNAILYNGLLKFTLLFCIGWLISGCATKPSRGGIISKELPLTVQDLAEIREGEENHTRVLEVHTVYENPSLVTYLNLIASNVAAVSTRPHLPYRVYILDTDEVTIFGGPGGYIYVTKGMLDFVRSESEIAGLIAHEIGHISHFDYAHIPHQSKMGLLYKGMLKGTELAKNSIGTYGTAAHTGVKMLGKTGPVVARRFGEDAEIVADKKGIEYLVEAGYDPRGFQSFVDRLSKIPMQEVVRFVAYLNTHPPFQVRRDILNTSVGSMALDEGRIEFKADTLNEVRQITVNQPEKLIPAENERPMGSILFDPVFGLSHSNPSTMNDLLQNKHSKTSPRRRVTVT